MKFEHCILSYAARGVILCSGSGHSRQLLTRRSQGPMRMWDDASAVLYFLLEARCGAVFGWQPQLG